ncbi:MAG: RsmD family RNA methyltransferase [Gemmatimonadetes bacterium]|nr:RsmD family RNA methyltransferase [Gemmatimonadota bacterium]
MRIVAGTWAGRSLTSPGQRVRATAEAVRAAWLDALESRLRGAKVLELFAGSGALGLEALSRGSASVDFVESGASALHALKANVAAFRLRPPGTGKSTARRKTARIFKRDAIPFVQTMPALTYDLAFADPPYRSAKLELVVARWMGVPFARVLGVEHAVDHIIPEGGRRLEVGETVVTLYGL